MILRKLARFVHSRTDSDRRILRPCEAVEIVARSFGSPLFGMEIRTHKAVQASKASPVGAHATYAFTERIETGKPKSVGIEVFHELGRSRVDVGGPMHGVVQILRKGGWERACSSDGPLYNVLGKFNWSEASTSYRELCSMMGLEPQASGYHGYYTWVGDYRPLIVDEEVPFNRLSILYSDGFMGIELVHPDGYPASSTVFEACPPTACMSEISMLRSGMPVRSSDDIGALTRSPDAFDAAVFALAYGTNDEAWLDL